jgi:hypothetical protein
VAILDPDQARALRVLRYWFGDLEVLAVNPSVSMTAWEAAELLGVSCSRAEVLLQQERAAGGGSRP